MPLPYDGECETNTVIAKAAPAASSLCFIVCLSSQMKVPTTDKPGVTLNFRKLLLNRCQKEFEKDKDDVTFEKQKELDAATGV